MTNIDNSDFKWDLLLADINAKMVIPIIGRKLCQVEIKSENRRCCLYDYLADKALEACVEKIDPDENHRFARACYEFLKKKGNISVLSSFLTENVKAEDLKPDPFNSLQKLARIRGFDRFITTAYDNLLCDAIKKVRKIPTKVDGFKGSVWDVKNNNSFPNSINNSEFTQIFTILGNFEVSPSYTEMDMLETIVALQVEIFCATNAEHNFVKGLNESSLLFLGCDFNDWLFCFLLRILGDKVLKKKFSSRTPKLIVVDTFPHNKRAIQGLPHILKENGVDVCQYNEINEFVDLLFKNFQDKYPTEIIHETDFPRTAFISFIGNDRDLAIKLADYLIEDGVHVWLDRNELEIGDKIDETIIKAINNCYIFIPLISENSRKIQTDDGFLKYHIREWEKAYDRFLDGNIMIFPVIVDKTTWKYDKFKGLYHYDTPNCDRGGEFDKLKDILKNIQG